METKVDKFYDRKYIMLRGVTEDDRDCNLR